MTCTSAASCQTHTRAHMTREQRSRKQKDKMPRAHQVGTDGKANSDITRDVGREPWGVKASRCRALGGHWHTHQATGSARVLPFVQDAHCEKQPGRSIRPAVQRSTHAAFGQVGNNSDF